MPGSDGVDEEMMNEAMGDMDDMGPAGGPRELNLAALEDPGFGGTAFSGKEITLGDYRGKVVLVDFWGTWCSPCVASLPELQRIREVLQPHGLTSWVLLVTTSPH